MSVLKKTISAILIFFFFLNLQAKDLELKIVVTSDIHATLFPYDFINNRPLGYGLANVTFLLEAARMTHSNRIVLLDNGDLIQGQPTAYYANFIDDNKTNLFARVLNLMKYDAAVIGNHDIEAGPEIYNKIKKQMNMPLLGANIIDKITGKPYFQPYVIISRRGIRIAVIGLITDATPTWLPQKLWDGMEFQNLPEAAEYWIKQVKENEKPDVIIGLFHSGMGSYNPEKPEDKPFGDASGYIAHFVPGFDVIFTGHDHTERNTFVINTDGDSVLVMGAGSYGKKVAVGHLTFERESRRVYNLKSKSGELFDVSSLPPSADFMTRFDKEISGVFEYSNKKVGTINTEINIKDALFGNSAAVDYLHKFQLEKANADISFAAPFRLGFQMSKGAIKVRDLYKWYPFENTLMALELTGEEIKNYLEYSYGLWFNQMQNEDDHLLSFKLDSVGNLHTGFTVTNMLKNRLYNFDSAAGVKYTVDLSKPAGERINIIATASGDKFLMGNKYIVAMNSYRASGGGSHLIKGAGIAHEDIKERVVFVSEKSMRHFLMEHIEKEGVIAPVASDNWCLIPEDWVEKAILRDKDILWPPVAD